MHYRKSLSLDRDDYVYVHMGVRDDLNGNGSYPFPSDEAAQRFARTHKERDPNRDIAVEYPDGREWEL